MKMSEKMVGALNRQMNEEFAAFYLYLSMAGYFEGRFLRGFAHWFRQQAEEEMQHAMRLYDYLHERDEEVKLLPLDAPTSEWDSAKAAVEMFLSQEQGVSASINKLADLAADERDHATNIFLQWYVNEQVEEEASATELLEKVKMMEGPNGLFLLDRELARRGGE